MNQHTFKHTYYRIHCCWLVEVKTFSVVKLIAYRPVLLSTSRLFCPINFPYLQKEARTQSTTTRMIVKLNRIKENVPFNDTTKTRQLQSREYQNTTVIPINGMLSLISSRNRTVLYYSGRKEDTTDTLSTPLW